VNPKILSNVKIRASYGSLGNGNIPPYTFNEKFGISQLGRVINGIRPPATSMPAVVPNGLTWETATTANLGLDFYALNSRLQFSGDIYQRKTTDMFTVGPTVPAIYGTSVPFGNYADLKTNGWELSINWDDQFNMASKPFHYNVRFTLADYKATITKYNNPDKNLTDYYEGQRVGEIWGTRWQVCSGRMPKSPNPLRRATSRTRIPGKTTWVISNSKTWMATM
jgi:outer membrane receptor protein involved in Fe transport